MIFVPRSLRHGPKGANLQTHGEPMTKTILSLLLRTSLCVLPLASAVACGSKAGEDYKGESLLQISGSVRMADEEAPGTLVPALAFTLEHTLLLQDLEVRGEFPAKFTLNVFEPPPPEAFFVDSRQPEIAIAYFTAVPREHENVIRLPYTFFDQVPCDGAPAEALYKWCLSETECYEESRRCVCIDDDVTYEPSCEVLATTGDPGFKNPWSKVSGLSQNYVVIYVPEHSLARLNEEKFYSEDYTGGKGFKLGYNLIHIRHTTPEEEQVARDCQPKWLAQAWAEYNAEHGTSWSADTILENDDEGHPYWAAYDWVWKRVQELEETIYCPDNAWVMTSVDPDTTSIDIMLGKVEERPFAK